MTRTQGLRASFPVLAVVVASGIAGAATPCAPTGVAVVDHLLTGVLAAAVALAATVASPVALAIGALTLLVAGASWPVHLIGLALVVLLAFLFTRDRRPPWVLALIGTAIVQSLLRLPGTSPERASAAVAAVGILPILLSAAWRVSVGRSVLRRRVGLVTVALGAVVVVGGLYIAARTDEILDEAQHDARSGVAAASKGDRATAAADFEAAGHEFRRARHFAGSWWTRPGRAVPIVSQQLRALDRVSSIGAEAVDVAHEAVARVDPDRLRFVNGRLDLATVAADHRIFDDAARRTDDIEARLSDEPDLWLAPPIEHAIERFRKVVASAGDSAHTAADALALAPSLLGADGTRTYFIAFVTPAEARGSGGLIANYGVLRAANGKIHLEKVGRGPDLDFAGIVPKHLAGLTDFQARYGRYDVANTWENVTMSPDLPTVAQAIAQLYPQSGGSRIDGVIEVGPVGMAGLLSLSGPIHVAGLDFPLNQNNIANFLVHDEYSLIKDQSARANLLGNIASATFDKLTSGTSAKPSDISQIMSPVVRSQQLAFWLRDPAGERFVRRIGADAGVPPAGAGDSFGATVQNGNGSKIDYYLHRVVRDVVHVDGRTGRVVAHVTVALHNASPAGNVPSYVIGNPFDLPDGTNRTILSLYSPLGLQRATLDGKPLTLVTERELGRNVWSDFVDIPPGGTRTVALDLTGTLDLSHGRYHFDYLPQVLANDDSVTLDVEVANAHTTMVTTSGLPAGAATRSARSVMVTVPSSDGRWSVDLGLRR